MDHSLTSRGTKRILSEYERPTDWSKEDMSTVVTMWEGGATVGAIANAVNRSRNAVAGQVFKLRKRGVLLERRIAGSVKTRVKVKAEIKSKPRLSKPTPLVVEPMPNRVRLRIVEEPTAVTLLELQPHHCKFPLGDPRQSDFRFCGGQRINDKKPYCVKHTEVAEQSPRASRRTEALFPLKLLLKKG